MNEDQMGKILVVDEVSESQKMEATWQLVRRVAHDFNNLLTAINGYSSLALKRTNPDERLRSYLEEIRKAGDRAADLTQQLLALDARKAERIPKHE